MPTPHSNTRASLLPLRFKPMRARQHGEEEIKPSALPRALRGSNSSHPALTLRQVNLTPKLTAVAAGETGIPVTSEDLNPLHRASTVYELNSAPRLTAIAAGETGIPASSYEAACLASFQSGETLSLTSHSPAAWDQLQGTLSAGASLRRQVMKASTLAETDPDAAFLLLRHLLDTHLSLSSVGSALTKPQEAVAMRIALIEFKKLQSVLRARETAPLSSKTPSLQLALNHLSLGALALNVKKIENKLKVREPRASRAARASRTSFINPITQEATPHPTEPKPLLELLAQSALDDLSAEKISPQLIHELKTPGWMKAALGTAFKGEDLDANSLMELVIQHTESLRRTRKEPVEISVMQTLGYLLAGLAAAFFMKYKVPTPFVPPALNDGDTEEPFDPLQAVLASATAVPLNSTGLNTTEISSPSALAPSASSLILSATQSPLGTSLANPSSSEAGTASDSASASDSGSSSASRTASKSGSSSGSNSASGSGSISQTRSPSSTPSAVTLPNLNNSWVLASGGTLGDYGFAMALTPEGSIVVTGYTDSFGTGGQNVLVAQYYPNGTFAWAKTLGGTNYDMGNALAINPEGSIILTGSTGNLESGSANVLVAQYYANGTFAWAKTLGGTQNDVGYALALNFEGSIIVTGITASFGAGGDDILVAQWYSNGTFAWAKTLGGPSTDYAYALALTPEGSIIVAGYTASFGAGSNDVLVTQWTANGTFTWAKTLGGPSTDYGNALALSLKGNIIVTGWTQSFGAGSGDALVAQWYPNGTFAWAKTLGGTSLDVAEALALSPRGDIVVTGTTASFGAGGYDVLVAQWYANDTFAWAKTLGGGGTDWGWSVALNPAGSIVVAGYTHSLGAGAPSEPNVLVAQLNNTGNLTFDHSFLLQSIPLIQDQSWNPSLSNITTASISSCPGIINQSWTSVNTSNIHPNVTLLYSDPSSAPSPSPSTSGSPARRRLEVYESRSVASENSRIPVKSSTHSSYESTATTAASLVGLGFILLLLWRFVHAHNTGGSHRKKNPVTFPKKPFFPEKTRIISSSVAHESHFSIKP